MIVAYVESNFLLELARQQDEAAEAQQILRLAESGAIEIAFPSLAVHEPFSTLNYYGNERAKLSEGFAPYLRELRRCATTKNLADSLSPLIGSLVQIKKTEMNALEDTVGRLLRCGRMIVLNHQIFHDATNFSKQLGLSPQDANILSSVLSDLKGLQSNHKKCFISKNSKDFDDEEVLKMLNSHDCKYLSSFKAALNYLAHLVSGDEKPVQ